MFLLWQTLLFLAGVNIGDNVVIGAGSIVTKDIPSNNPLCILNNANFDIIDISVKDKLVDILDNR